MLKYAGKEIGTKNCPITQICIAMAMLAGAFLTLVVIGLTMTFIF